MTIIKNIFNNGSSKKLFLKSPLITVFHKELLLNRPLTMIYY
jgi:hypothetical protein